MATNENLLPSIKRNNMSKKMIQAQMIRNRTSMTYGNSYYYNINLQLLSGRETEMKQILMTLGVKSFNRNMNKILMSDSIEDRIKDLLSFKVNNIFQNLNESERITLGINELDEEDIIISEQEEKENQLRNPDYIFFCKMIRENSFYFSITNLRRDFFFNAWKKIYF